MLWRSHRIKRVVRCTLAAETMAALGAVESGDMLRQHLVELHYGLGYGTHMDDVKAIKMVEVTDCKSLDDLLQKRGAVPSEAAADRYRVAQERSGVQQRGEQVGEHEADAHRLPNQARRPCWRLHEACTPDR
eukprot:7958474-Pyramimonas_sp.AAC.1